MQELPPQRFCPEGQLVAQPGVPLVVQPNMHVICAGVEHAPLPLHDAAGVAFPVQQLAAPQFVLVFG